MTKNYNLQNIKDFLSAGFNIEELRDLCFYTPELNPIYEELPEGGNKKRVIIREIITYAQQKGVIETLLTVAQGKNPTKFEQFQPYEIATQTSEPPPVPVDSEVSPFEREFKYDVYISYVDQEPDMTWVWETLIPQLKAVGLQYAVSRATGRRGVPQITNIEQATKQAKRIVLVLSQAYLTDPIADVENILGQMTGIWDRTYRLLPIKIEPFADNQMRGGLRMLEPLDLTQPYQAEHWFETLVQELKSPLPPRTHTATL